MEVKRVAVEAVGWTPRAEASTAMKMIMTMMMTMTARPRHPDQVKEAGECLNLMKMTK